MNTLRLRCGRCGRNWADVRQAPGEIISPRGYNGFTHNGLDLTWRNVPAGSEASLRPPYHHDETGPDITWSRRCLCGHNITVSGRGLAELWRANTPSARKLVRVAL